MGRIQAPTPREDWRERLFWGSLALLLIGFLLFGLVALARWGDATAALQAHGRVPGSTSVLADLLVPPPAPPTPFASPVPPLPEVGAAPRAARESLVYCNRERAGGPARPVALGPVGHDWCAIGL